MFETIKIYQSKTKVFMYLLIDLAFCALSPWLLMRGLEKGNAWHIFVSIVCFLFFGFCAVQCVKRFRQSTPMIEINEQGIVVDAHAYSVGLIAWQEIGGVKITTLETSPFSKQTFFVIDVFDDKKFLARMSGFQKIMALSSKKMGYSTQTFSLIGTDSPYTAEQLCAEIQKRLNYFQAAAK